MSKIKIDFQSENSRSKIQRKPQKLVGHIFDKDYFEDNTPKSIHQYYEQLRNILIQI